MDAFGWPSDIRMIPLFTPARPLWVSSYTAIGIGSVRSVPVLELVKQAMARAIGDVAAE